MSNESKPVKVPTSQLVFPNAEATSANQINNLLSLGSFALHALLRPADAHGNVPQDKTFPKEAEIAAENTFIKVLETMDALLADRTRWSMDVQRKLEARFDEAHSLNLQYLESQAEFARLMNTPHFRFKPTMMRLRDGRMLAILGHVDDLDNAICGVGNSAEEALKQFDEVFSQGVPEEVVKHCKQREQDLEAGRTPAPFPKTTEAEVVPERKTNRKRTKTK